MAELNNMEIAVALGRLRANKRHLTRQQLKTLRGQVLGGDPAGAMKGLQRILLLSGSNAIKKGVTT